MAMGVWLPRNLPRRSLPAVEAFSPAFRSPISGTPHGQFRGGSSNPASTLRTGVPRGRSVNLDLNPRIARNGILIRTKRGEKSQSQVYTLRVNECATFGYVVTYPRVRLLSMLRTA